jgi:hypothetical protein
MKRKRLGNQNYFKPVHSAEVDAQNDDGIPMP